MIVAAVWLLTATLILTAVYELERREQAAILRRRQRFTALRQRQLDTLITNNQVTR